MTIPQKYLQKILSSTEFNGSKIYTTYLTYLIDALESGKELKETTIAMEVFGKDANFNPAEDTIVRTHTYKLRKKLEIYYYKEGREDKYRLRIPKGHYNVKFVPAKRSSFFGNKLLGARPNPYYLLTITVLFLAVIVLIFLNQRLNTELNSYKVIDIDDPIWKDYLQSDLPILMTLGNHFFFNDYIEKYKHDVDIRHSKVNSYEDMNVLKNELSLPNITPTPEPYFPYHSVWSVPPILTMLDEYNIIFLGSIKTLYILRHTLLKSNFDFQISPHKIFYTPPDSSETQIFETSLHSEGPNEDLVLALKLPGPAQNSIFIIASYHSLGAPEVVSYLIEPDTRHEMEDLFMERFGEVPKYFEILFRVSGIDKTAYSTDILVYNKISPN